MSVEPSWNLEHTSQSVIGIARGVLHAATTDNVQALAIAACEQFGNTLAMSRDTLLKIEHSVVPTPTPAILTFLKTTIGYCANDCTSYFGSSNAGLQFLGLAVALVTYKDIHSAAKALQVMLFRSATDRALCPTIRQLRDLLASVEPRCRRVSFADDVVGWGLLLRRHPGLANTRNPAWELARDWAPAGEGLADLFDALRQLNRLGNADITRVIIRTNKCAAWTISFVKWSLGHPPSVARDGAAMPIVEQPDSQVTVIITDEGNDEFSDTTYSSIHGPSEQVAPVPYEATAGMVSLPTYGQCSMENSGFSSGLGAKAYQEAIPYALRLATRALSSHISVQYDKQVTGTTDRTSTHPRAGSDKSTAIPLRLGYTIAPSPVRESSIARVYKLLFDQELGTITPRDDRDISNLPQVAYYMEGCSCSHCDPDDPEKHFTCRRYDYFHRLSGIVVDVLALSLVECPDLLQVSSVCALQNSSHGSLDGLWRILQKVESEGIRAWDILQRGMEILGHDVQRLNASEWVLSSAKGQAVWPTIYETRSYDRQGYLSLSWHPGLLKHKGDTYDIARSAQASATGSDPITTICKEQVRKPCNLCPDDSRLGGFHRSTWPENWIRCSLCRQGLLSFSEPSTWWGSQQPFHGVSR